jgi:hypothetical protein
VGSAGGTRRCASRSTAAAGSIAHHLTGRKGGDGLFLSLSFPLVLGDLASERAVVLSGDLVVALVAWWVGCALSCVVEVK